MHPNCPSPNAYNNSPQLIRCSQASHQIRVRHTNYTISTNQNPTHGHVHVATDQKLHARTQQKKKRTRVIASVAFLHELQRLINQMRWQAKTSILNNTNHMTQKRHRLILVCSAEQLTTVHAYRRRRRHGYCITLSFVENGGWCDFCVFASLVVVKQFSVFGVSPCVVLSVFAPMPTREAPQKHVGCIQSAREANVEDCYDNEYYFCVVMEQPKYN